MAKQQSVQKIPLIAIRGRVIFPGERVSFDVGRLASLSAVEKATSTDRRFIACLQKDEKKADVTLDNICSVGTVSRITQVTKLSGNNVRVTVEGLYISDILSVDVDNYSLIAKCVPTGYVSSDPQLEEIYLRSVKSVFKELALVDSKISKEFAEAVEWCVDADDCVNLVARILNVPPQKKQELLEMNRTKDRIEKLNEMLGDEVEFARLERKIQAEVRRNVDKNQKDYYLREQLKVIHNELGDDEEERDEIERKIKERRMSEEAEKKCLKELSRMSRMQQTSPDYNVLRMYLDWMTDIPWTEKTEDNTDLKTAVKILNDDHYGLEKIKERITEYLAVFQLTKGLNAPIICLVGPPGVGKTSIAKSIARALDRKFVRMSLGGVRDEAEIRGHRKTYVGAMPGRIMQGLKTAQTINPVFLLDEIDKLSSDSMHGDPSSALLEVLDPEQNSTFRDRYLEIPYDLSKILFITTANGLDTIPHPLLDRMEVIELSGYTLEEKREIAKRYLVPKKGAANGIKEGSFKIDDGALDAVIEGYTLEAGVRSLERKIDAICRKIAVRRAEGDESMVLVTAENVCDFLGVQRFERDEALARDEIGAATGLAWTSVGGTTLTIEVAAMRGKGEILLTGKLGDVMKESARAAISYIRSNSATYGLDDKVFDNTDIHIHVPEGATPKDGPSAGITMATAILSAFTQKPVKKSVAMTGEITLRGKVLPIGGLKEKALAAYRLGLRDIIIPCGNKKDLEDIPAPVRDEINFIPVGDVDTVFKTAIDFRG